MKKYIIKRYINIQQEFCFLYANAIVSFSSRVHCTEDDLWGSTDDAVVLGH